jgi:hypothetical protein
MSFIEKLLTKKRLNINNFVIIIFYKFNQKKKKIIFLIINFFNLNKFIKINLVLINLSK